MKCHYCGKIKSKNYFDKNPWSPTGHSPYCRICRGKIKPQSVSYRELCLRHYGYKCQICGAKDNLCIDHIDAKLQPDMRGETLYKWLAENKFPDGFRTLCGFCNILDGYVRKAKFLRLSGINELMSILEAGRRK